METPPPFAKMSPIHRRLLLLLSLALLVLAGCTLRRTYEVTGRVVGFGDDGRTVIVEHEDIPGLMSAMTMAFTMRHGTALDGIALREAVRFRLVVTRDSSWIDRLETLPDSAVADHPAGTPDPLFEPSASSPLLTTGASVPPFTLVNQDGETFQSVAFEGRLLLLTFIYTRCPLPDFCPRLSRHFQNLQPRLIDRFDDRVHLLSISFDPSHDTPEVLHTYARRYTDNTRQWTFATGAPEEIARVAGGFGVFYTDNGEEFDHNLATALIGPDGRVRRLWRGADWQPEEVLEAIEEVLDDG